MWQLTTAVAEIALRRRGPDSLPDSAFLVVFLLGLHIPVIVAKAFVLFGELNAQILIRIAAEIVLFFAFVYAVLCFFRLERRFRQTVSAMLGADIFISLSFLPVGIAGFAFGFGVLEQPFVWVTLAFDVWFIFIASSILARSLSQPLIVGFMLEILLILTSFYVGQLLATPAEQVAVESA